QAEPREHADQNHGSHIAAVFGCDRKDREYLVLRTGDVSPGNDTLLGEVAVEIDPVPEALPDGEQAHADTQHGRRVSFRLVREKVEDAVRRQIELLELERGLDPAHCQHLTSSSSLPSPAFIRPISTRRTDRNLRPSVLSARHMYLSRSRPQR